MAGASPPTSCPRAVNLWNGVLKDFSLDEYRTLVRLFEKLFASMQERQCSLIRDA